MKRILRFPLLLLALLLVLGSAQSAWATHIQGGQLTYRWISGNNYEIAASLYYDCSSSFGSLPPTLAAQARTGGCNGPSTSVTLTLVPGSTRSGTGYCPSIQVLATCNPGNPLYPNYLSGDYRGTVSLPPAAEWTISYESGDRPSTANITTQAPFRFEAKLNNLLTVGGSTVVVNNNSPAFSTRDYPITFVTKGQRSALNFTATDANATDSLVYSLERPLSTCGVFNIYSQYPVTGCSPTFLVINPPCLLQCPPFSSSTYTAQLPISVTNDTTGTCSSVPGSTSVRTVVPRFSFDPQSGQFIFTPNQFLPGNNNLGLNKYVVVGKVTDYRRLPGSNRRYLVGSVRRDMLVIVIDGSNNVVPLPPIATPVTPGSSTTAINTADTTRITLYSCNYSQVRIRFTDPDNIVTATNPVSRNQRLTVTYTGLGTIDDVLENGDIGTFTPAGNGTTSPTYTFFFQPSPAFAGQTRRIALRIEDDACPIKGVQTRIIILRILRGNFAAASAIIGAPGLSPATPSPTRIPATICPGGTLQLQGSVQRPDSVRNGLQTYTYQWTGAGIVGAANNLNGSVTVRPTVTTYYKVRVVPARGFQQGLCFDVDSVLVRVAPEPTVAIVSSLTQVCAGAPVDLTATATRADNLTDTYTYRWTGPGVAANTTGAALTVRPTVPGINTYTVVANGATPYGCDATQTVQIEVVPAPVVAISRSLPQVCAGAPVKLKAVTTRPAGAGSTLADTYTYQWSGPGVSANATADSLLVNPTTLGINTYTVTVTGLATFGCSATQTVQVEVVRPPVVTATPDVRYVCIGGTARLSATTVAPTGFSDIYTYTWTGPGLAANASGATLAVQPTVPGINTYTVTATGNARFGCSADTTVQVEVLPAVVADFIVSDSTRSNRPPVSFTLRSTNVAPGPAGVATLSYQWTYQRVRDIAGAPATPLDNPVVFGTSTSAMATTPALALSGSYLIKLTTTVTVNGSSCTASVKTRTVVVPDLQVPNVITPNADGLNDVFKVSSANTSSKLEIYNRWGRKVYEQANYQNTWGADNQPAGVYYYLLTDRNGASTKGWIEVMR